MIRYKAPMTKPEIKAVCKRFGITINTDIGQHFLVDQGVLHTIVDTMQRGNTASTILEVGTGLGVLTERLVQRAEKVISVELDTRLEPVLQKLEQQYLNLTIVRGDILRVDLKALGLQSGEFIVVANLPYQITSHFIRQMLTQEPFPKRMVLLIQQEVAERIVAQPGQLSILALSVRLFAQPRIIAAVPPQSFYPAPKVHSAIIDIDLIRQRPLLSQEREIAWFRLIKAGFAQKRKILRSNLKNINQSGKKIPDDVIDNAWRALHIKKTARAQEISLETWLKLLDKLESFVI